MRRYLLTATIAAMLCAVRASAATQTITATVPTTPTDFTQVVPIAQFNPALGTLTMVVVRLNASLDASLIAENRSTSGPATLTGSISESATCVPPIGPNLFGSANSTPTTPQTVAAYDGVPFTVDPLGPDTAHWSITGGSVDVSNTYTAAGDLAVYTGLGNLNYTVIGDSAFSLSSTNGNIAAQGSATVGATITVTYTYVPEPASLGLLGMGFATMLLRRRR